MYLSNKPWDEHCSDKSAKECSEYFLGKWADKFPQYINTALFALENKNVTE